MTIIAHSSAYSIPVDHDRYISLWTDYPATSIKMQLKSMTGGREGGVIDIDPKTARIILRAIGDLSKNIAS